LGEGLYLHVAEVGADAERLDELARNLRAELLQLDVDDVRTPSVGEPPEGARVLDVVAVGALLVTLGRTAAGLTTVVTSIRKWLARGTDPTRTVRLEIGGDTLELSSVTAAEQERLISTFISRHAGVT
jgi:hypothetical protein